MGRKLLCLLVLGGCGGTKVSQDAFLTALPKREQVQVVFPDGSVHSEAQGVRSDALLGQIADLYVVTRETSQHLNGVVGSLLETLGRITQMPPSHIEENRAVWGPFTPVLSPVNYRLVVQRVAPDEYVYQLDARPKSSMEEESFAPVVTGIASPHRQTGSFSIDLNRLHQLDPVGTPQTGAIGFVFEFTPQRGIIRIHLESFAEPGGQAISADYVYVQGPDGSGDFLFVADSSLSSAVSPDLQGSLLRSRWLPSGAGRGDAQVSDDVERDITECWDENFGRVFFIARPGPTEGDPARCVFRESPAPIE
jgi:hypothetical protein